MFLLSTHENNRSRLHQAAAVRRRGREAERSDRQREEATEFQGVQKKRKRKRRDGGGSLYGNL